VGGTIGGLAESGSEHHPSGEVTAGGWLAVSSGCESEVWLKARLAEGPVGGAQFKSF